MPDCPDSPAQRAGRGAFHSAVSGGSLSVAKSVECWSAYHHWRRIHSRRQRGDVFDGSVTLPNFQPKLDAGFLIGALSLIWSSSTNQLIADADPWLRPLTLIPLPSSTTLQAALNDALPRLLFSSAASAIFESLMGPGFKVPPLDMFFSSTSKSMSQPSALGNSSGTGLNSGRITQLLQAIDSAAGFPPGPGLSLPGGLQLTASGAGTDDDPTKLQLATTTPIGGVVGITVGVSFDSLMHVTPSGSVSLTIPLPGTGWTGLGISFGASEAGVSLVLTPQATGVSAIEILPTFSGLGALQARPRRCCHRRSMR